MDLGFCEERTWNSETILAYETFYKQIVSLAEYPRYLEFKKRAGSGRSIYQAA